MRGRERGRGTRPLPFSSQTTKSGYRALNPAKQPIKPGPTPSSPLVFFSLSTLLDGYALKFVCVFVTIVLASSAASFLLSSSMIHSEVIRPETRARQRKRRKKTIGKKKYSEKKLKKGMFRGRAMGGRGPLAE